MPDKIVNTGVMNTGNGNVVIGDNCKIGQDADDE